MTVCTDFTCTALLVTGCWQVGRSQDPDETQDEMSNPVVVILEAWFCTLFTVHCGFEGIRLPLDTRAFILFSEISGWDFQPVGFCPSRGVLELQSYSQ